MFISNASRTIRILLAIAMAVPLALSAVRQQTIAKKELKSLTVSAKKPAEHQRIVAYYRSEAERLEAKQREHEQELAEYYQNPARYPGKYPTKGDHCRSLIAHYKMAAANATAQADMHERLAQEAR